MKGINSFWEKENFGKLFIRLFLGLFFVASGVRYFSGGVSALQLLGAIFNVIGITFWPIIFGIISAVILVLSGMCFLIGFFYRLNCGLLLAIFFLKALGNGYSLGNFFDAEFLLNILITLSLFAFLFMGAGRFSSDGK
jgi:putative oxidoreductase